MTREDQINAQLAAAVALERQKAALDLKNSFPNDELAALTDDEAIIIADRVYNDLSKDQKTTEIISWAIGFVLLVVLLGTTQNPWVSGLGAIPALAFYAWKYESRKKNIGLEIVGSMIQAGEQKIAQKKLHAQSRKMSDFISPGGFDVPPQDGS